MLDVYFNKYSFFYFLLDNNFIYFLFLFFIFFLYLLIYIYFQTSYKFKFINVSDLSIFYYLIFLFIIFIVFFYYYNFYLYFFFFIFFIYIYSMFINYNNNILVYLFFIFFNFFSLLYLSFSFNIFYISLLLEGYMLSNCLIISFDNNFNIRTIESTLKYFFINALTGIVFLFGISFLYFFSGSFDLYYIISNTYINNNDILLFIGFFFSFIGISSKLYIFPGNMWVPSVYNNISFNSLFYISCISPMLLFYFFYKIYNIFFYYNFFYYGLVIISFFSFFIGLIGMLTQNSFKGILAYSSIYSSGYFFLGLVDINIIEQSFNIIIFYFILLFLFFLLISNVFLYSKKNIINFFYDISGHIFYSNFYFGFFLFLIFFFLCGFPFFFLFYAKIYTLFLFLKLKYFFFFVLFLISGFFSYFFYIPFSRHMSFNSNSLFFIDFNNNLVNFKINTSFVSYNLFIFFFIIFFFILFFLFI